jgi:hypothetical protein
LWKLPTDTRKTDSEGENSGFFAKVQRIDFVGAVTLAATISAFLLALDLVTKQGPWWHVLIPALLFVFLAGLFWAVERFYAKEPILPIELITERDTITPYLIAGVQIAAQFGVLSDQPTY